jgi:hypothetical protein
MVRLAVNKDFDSIGWLYAQLHPTDPPMRGHSVSADRCVVFGFLVEVGVHEEDGLVASVGSGQELQRSDRWDVIECDPEALGMGAVDSLKAGVLVVRGGCTAVSVFHKQIVEVEAQTARAHEAHPCHVNGRAEDLAVMAALAMVK